MSEHQINTNFIIQISNQLNIKSVQQNKIMNQRSQSIGNSKGRYQSFYFKKLQTQTSISSDCQNKFLQTSQILEKQIKKMENNLHKKNFTFTKNVTKRIQLQKEQQINRSTIKSRLEQKMRKSHNNMLQYRQKSNSSLSSRRKAQNQKIQEIKKLQKTMYDQKYQISKQYSTKTQKFFDDLQQKRKSKSRQISIDTSYFMKSRKKTPLFSPISNKNIQQRDSSFQKSSKALNPQSKKSFFSLLKTPRQSILQKQKKKLDQQKAKQNSFLREYVKKMQLIEQTRKKVRIDRKNPQTTVAKLINRQYNQEQFESRKKFSKSYMQQAVNSKESFSDLYQKKLLEKKEKKIFFLSQSIATGDNIIKNDTNQTNKFKLNKLIRETQNQLARKQNFRYMEKFLQKAF